LKLNRAAVGSSNAEGGGKCVGVVNNVALTGDVKAGAVIVDESIAATRAARTGAAGAPAVARAPDVIEAVESKLW